MQCEPTRDVLASKQNKVGSTVISQYDYTVNAIGQRTNVTTSGTAFPAAPNWAWAYDSLGQVTSADSTEATHDRAYQYDAIGNRIEARDGVAAVSGTPNYTANLLNQYTSVGSVSPLHDDDGNMTSGQIPAGSAGLVWDAENRLIAVNVTAVDTVHYSYDAQSRRIANTTGTTSTLTIYDAWNPKLQETQITRLYACTTGLIWQFPFMARRRWIVPWADSETKPAIYHCIARVVDK